MPEQDSALVDLLRETLSNQTQMLRDEFGAMRREMVATRRQVIGLVALAMVLMAAMVGVDLHYQSQAGSLSVTPSDAVEPTEEPAPQPGAEVGPHAATLPWSALDAISAPAQAVTDGTAVAPVPGYVQPDE